MSMEYREWQPSEALCGTVLAFWNVCGDGRSVPSPTILPDAYVEIVINLGDPVTLVFGPGRTARQPARTVVGLLDRAVAMRYGRRVRTLGIRLHPARAANFLGVASVRLANALSPVRRLAPAFDADLADWLRSGPDVTSPTDRAALERLLEAQQRLAAPAERLVTHAVDRLLEADDPVTVVDIARELRVSPRHLHRRFVATVGVPPKRLERLARFARTWQQATLGPTATWTELAHGNGYADQAHLIREFRAFGANPPAHLFTPEWYGTTNVTRAGGADRVRFVQARAPRHA